MERKNSWYYLKRSKTYLYYLFLVIVTLFLVFLFFYNNPSFLAQLNNSIAIAETEEDLDNPFPISSNTTVQAKEEATGWVWPTTGGYYISQTYHTGHDGIDIAGCPYNSNIYAASSGKVVTVARKWDNGLYIIIGHPDGRHTLYAHLASVSVSNGQQVRTGQIIGGMGKSGYATGVHLHFSLWTAYPYYGHPLNPFSLY